MIGVMMILGGFAVIYVIAVKLGNKDNTASDLDRDGKPLNSNDSEIVSSIVLFKAYTTGGTVKKESIVVVKPCLLPAILLFGFFLMFAIVGLWVYFQEDEIFALVLGVIAMAIGILYLTMPLTVKTILDDNGITRRFNIRLGRFTVFCKSTLVPWSVVSSVCYTDIFNNIPGFRFYYTKRSGETDGWSNLLSFININFTGVNYKKAIEYAVKKLPESKFQGEARDKLKIMGIWQ